jgi:hypothetical protein
MASGNLSNHKGAASEKSASIFLPASKLLFALFHPDKNPTQVLVNTSSQVKAITPQTLSTNHNRYPAAIVLSCRSAALLNKGA